MAATPRPSDVFPFVPTVAAMALPLRILQVTKGHPFEREPFLAIFDDDATIAYEHVEHPEAQLRWHPDRLGDVDSIVFYDMPGLQFTRGDPPVELLAPDPPFVAGFEALLAHGVGIVMLHHSIASWPTWPRDAQVVGGRFHYDAGDLWGQRWPDSGYLLDVTHTVEVLAADHPLRRGLPAAFELHDDHRDGVGDCRAGVAMTVRALTTH